MKDPDFHYYAVNREEGGFLHCTPQTPSAHLLHFWLLHEPAGDLGAGQCGACQMLDWDPRILLSWSQTAPGRARPLVHPWSAEETRGCI